jgi:hypothetical protein
MFEGVFNPELFVKKNGKKISTSLLPASSSTYPLKVLQANMHK